MVDFSSILTLSLLSIPQNDIWIAAIAQQYDLTLVTRDEHFREVGQLKVEVW